MGDGGGGDGEEGGAAEALGGVALSSRRKASSSTPGRARASVALAGPGLLKSFDDKEAHEQLYLCVCARARVSVCDVGRAASRSPSSIKRRG